MIRIVLIFGALSALVWILFETSRYSISGYFDSGNYIYILSGILFIALGFILNKILFKKSGRINLKDYKESPLTPTEFKVLQLMEEGMSNSEIAEKLFVSETTIKTHVSNILAKLNARRRTEAIKISREMELL